MVKAWPVIVVSPKPEHYYTGLCIVACLSTTVPDPVREFHLLLDLPGALPEGLDRQCWLKGDMIYTVSLERLDFYRKGRDARGRRAYYQERFYGQTLREIRRAVACACGFVPCKDA